MQSRAHLPLCLVVRYTLPTSSSMSLSPFWQMVIIFSPATQSAETAARAFSEMAAAVFHFVRLSGFPRV